MSVSSFIALGLWMCNTAPGFLCDTRNINSETANINVNSLSENSVQRGLYIL